MGQDFPSSQKLITVLRLADVAFFVKSASPSVGLCRYSHLVVALTSNVPLAHIQCEYEILVLTALYTLKSYIFGETEQQSSR